MKKIFLGVLFLIIIFFAGYFLIKDKTIWQKELEVIKNQSEINQNVNQKQKETDLSNEKNTQITEEKSGKIFLEIISPQNQTTVNNSLIKIIGKTAANAEVFVNEKETKSDNQGNFSLDYSLTEGENELIIVVNDSQGNYLEKTLIITYESL